VALEDEPNGAAAPVTSDEPKDPEPVSETEAAAAPPAAADPGPPPAAEPTPSPVADPAPASATTPPPASERRLDLATLKEMGIAKLAAVARSLEIAGAAYLK
jgi:hypothetical protein